MALFVPFGVVTSTLAVPTVPAGVRHCIVELLWTKRLVHALPPIVTPVAPVKLVPPIVTSVPPDLVPEVGLMLVTVGGGVAGTTSPVDRIVAGKLEVPLKKTICESWDAVRPDEVDPTNILPAVPDVPLYPPVQPVIVSVLPAVHATPLLAVKVKL